MRKKLLLLKRSLILVLSLILFASLVGITCNADTMVEDYSPIFYFEGEETCYPISAEFHIQNSYLYQVEISSPISTNPSESEISSYSSDLYQNYYLDNQLGTIDNFDQIIGNAKLWESTNGNVVYYHIIGDTSTGEGVIQYWMFYAFNKGELNKHEGDWEMVQISFSGGEPSQVAYSQHHSGQKASWGQVEKDGNNINVYVARGSHANYLRSYSGKLGIASDIVGDNGRVLDSNDYQLIDLEQEGFVNFSGKWGEVGQDEAASIESSLLGQAGPEGPKFREGGAMWGGISWGNSLLPSNNTLFLAEWFLYNFLLIFALISIAILGLMAFRIYRRHKKYGLGPRIVSMLYIDGFNLHSIGNILCIVGIIIAVIGLFNPWYTVSYSATGTGVTDTFQTKEMIDLLSFDGFNGLQVNIPGAGGPVPMGSVVLPFSVLILIGLIFMIIATIGIPLSRKLGGKYIWRGIRLIIPFILIVIVMIAISSLIPSMAGEGESSYIQDIIGPLKSSPLGGESSTTITESDVTAQINLSWGIGLGIWMLFISGIIMMVAGILEFSSKHQFFVTKIPLPGKAPPVPQQKHHPPPPPPKHLTPEPEKKKDKKAKSGENFCSECGAKLDKNAIFCDECGNKV
jgi:hypothetical protein